VRLSDDVARKMLAGASLGFGCDSTGMVRQWPSSGQVIYPPLGYLPWNALQVGNGDTYGYYWPVGQESRDPIVCTTEHDNFRVVPFASTLAGCLRLVRATQPEIVDEVKEVARAFSISLAGVRASDAATAARALATLDSQSPHVLLMSARDALRSGDLAQCERTAAQALDLLPEYGEAAWVLSQAYRRQQRFEEAARVLLIAIGSPFCFSVGYDLRLKCLKALQGMKNDLLADDDPLWRERQRLTFRTGVKQSDDFCIYEEGIESYFAAGAGVHAIWLRMLVGELMLMETVSFRERHGWSPTDHRQKLRRDLLRAGLSARAGILDATSAP
jgi:hypothetical protein